MFSSLTFLAQMGCKGETPECLPCRCWGDWSRSQTGSHSHKPERQVHRSHQGAGGGGLQEHPGDGHWVQAGQGLGHWAQSGNGFRRGHCT